MGSLKFLNSAWMPISRVDDWWPSFRIGRRNVSPCMPTIPRANTSHQRRARFLSSYLRRSRPRTRAKQFQADSETATGIPDILVIASPVPIFSVAEEDVDTLRALLEQEKGK